jgi:hypothetical protein
MKPRTIVYKVETRGTSFERSFDLSTPDEQVYLYKNNPPAFIMSSRFKEVEQIVNDLGLPNFFATQYYSRIFSGLESFKGKKPYEKKYKKYPVEIFGRRVPVSEGPNLLAEYQPLPDSSECFAPKYLYESYDFLVEIWRIRIFAHRADELKTDLSRPLSPQYPSVLYLEERWHPEHGIRIQLGGLENMSGPRIPIDLKSFTMAALQILRRVRGPGKPPGIYKRYKDRDEFKRKVLEVYSELRYVKPKPSRSAVAALMGTSFDTLVYYLDEFSIPWPPLETGR